MPSTSMLHWNIYLYTHTYTHNHTHITEGVKRLVSFVHHRINLLLPLGRFWNTTLYNFIQNFLLKQLTIHNVEGRAKILSKTFKRNVYNAATHNGKIMDHLLWKRVRNWNALTTDQVKQLVSNRNALLNFKPNDSCMNTEHCDMTPLTSC